MNRDKFGMIMVQHKGKKITTSVGSTSYEGIFAGQSSNMLNGRVPKGYEHRPDLIADLFLDTPGGWWVICETNSIFDIFEELNSGDNIKLPRGL